MAETKKKSAAGSRAKPKVEPEAAAHVCTVAFCPIGLALTAAEQVRPDVVHHLVAAGQEFFLAAKAVMDVRAEDIEGRRPTGPAKVERIDIA